MRGLLSATTALLLLGSAWAALPVSASPAPVLDAVVAGLTLTGSSAIEGPLSSLHSTGDDGADSARAPAVRPPPSDVTFVAHRLHIETDGEEWTGTAFAGPRSRMPTDASTMTDASASLLVARQGFSFLLAPMAGHAPPQARIDRPSVLLSADNGTFQNT